MLAFAEKRAGAAAERLDLEVEVLDQGKALGVGTRGTQLREILVIDPAARFNETT